MTSSTIAGMMVIPAFYSSSTAEALFRHFARILEATELPILHCNKPATAKADQTPPILARLSMLRRLDYIKHDGRDAR